MGKPLLHLPQFNLFARYQTVASFLFVQQR
jgi:hypothetical protein